MDKKFTHYLILFFAFCCLLSQFPPVMAQKMAKPPFKISQQQMYEDFDQFLHIIEIYNAQWEILSKAEKWEDTFQCIPEIEVIPTIEQLNDYNYARFILELDDFLLNHDYLFKKVLELP